MVHNTDPLNSHQIQLTADKPAGWIVTFPAGTQNLDLNAQESRLVTVKVEPKSDAGAGSYTVKVRGQYSDDSSTWDEVTMTVQIKEIHKVEMTVSPNKVKIDGEEDAEFSVKLVNKGNLAESVTVSVRIESESNLDKASITLSGNESDKLTISIPRNGEKTVNVVISPPDDVKHGASADVRIEVGGSEITTTAQTVSIEVEKEFGPRFTEVMSDPYVIMLLILTFFVIGFAGIAARGKKHEKVAK
jgi:uncharacterized membrane protein